VASAPPGRPSPSDHRTFITVTAPDGDGIDPGGESAAHAAALRDLFGNPFRAASFSPEWRTEAVVGLARGMYESREFSAMPVLADALEDAGCADDDILSHCRGQGPHTRGCWVVDMVLGKA